MKPLHENDYEAAETALVLSTVLTVATALGNLHEHVCIVGGIVPKLLVDLPEPEHDESPHCGSNDLDIGLSLALLDDSRYSEIADRLRRLEFGPSVNDKGNPRLQHWHNESMNVDIDFLMPARPDDEAGSIQPLERDFGALLTRGLGLAFTEIEERTISGVTLEGHQATRDVNVCGPASFVVLKSLAFGDRAEPKDVYDLVYVLEHWGPGLEDVARRLLVLRGQGVAAAETVAAALAVLARDFETIDHIGPRKCAMFSAGDDDAVAADAMAVVMDLLDLLGLEP